MSEVFDAAAQALTRASRDVADHGRPAADAPEARHFAVLLIKRLVDDRDVVDIGELCPLGQPSIVRRGTPPDTPAAGHSGLGRDADPRRVPGARRRRTGTGGECHPARPRAVQPHRRARFAPPRRFRQPRLRPRVVRRGPCGSPSSREARPPTRPASPRRSDRPARSSGGSRRAATPEQASTELAGLAAVLGQSADAIVPIESLAPDDDVVPSGVARARATPEDASLAGSFLTYARLSGEVAAPLGQRWGRAPIRTAGRTRPAATPAAPPAVPTAEEAVDIGTLLYRGDAALRRADIVRQDLTNLLRAGAGLSSHPPAPRRTARPGPAGARALRLNASRHRAWQVPLALAVSAALLWWAFRDVDFHEALGYLRAVRIPWLLAAVAVATSLFPLRLVRWRLLLRREDGRPYPWLPLWHAVAMGFAANNVLPFRAGEVVRTVAASRLTGARLSTSLASVAVERVFDALTVVGLLSLALLMPGMPPGFTVAGHPGPARGDDRGRPGRRGPGRRRARRGLSRGGRAGGPRLDPVRPARPPAGRVDRGHPPGPRRPAVARRGWPAWSCSGRSCSGW